MNDACNLALQEAAKLLNSFKDAGAGKKATTLYRAALLTSPSTHSANISGNTTMAALEAAKDVPATILDSLLGMATGKRTKAMPSLGSVGRGAAQGAKDFAMTAKTGLNPTVAKFEGGDVHFDNAFLETATQAVYRSLDAEDAFFRRMALTRSIEEQARVMAKNEGFKGDAYSQRVQQLIQKPTDQMAIQGMADADYATFQNRNALSNTVNQAKGAIGRNMGQGARALSDVVAPFTKVPTNIALRFLDYTPGSSLYTIGKEFKGLTSGLPSSQRRIVESMGRNITGGGVALIGWMMAQNGMFAGTPEPGRAGTDERRRLTEEGKVPNGFRIGNRWMDPSRLGPGGDLLILGGQLYNRAHDPNGFNKAGAGLDVARTAAGETFVPSALDTLNAFNPASGDANESTLGRALGGIAGGVVPNLLGTVAKGSDPYERDLKGDGFLDTVERQIQSRIPGHGGPFLPGRQDLPPKMTSFGQPVKRDMGLAGSLLSPMRYGVDKQDSLTRELRRLDINISQPDRTGSEKKQNDKGVMAKSDYKLSKSEYQRFLSESGAKIRKKLYDALIVGGVGQSDDWKKKRAKHIIDQEHDQWRLRNKKTLQASITGK